MLVRPLDDGSVYTIPSESDFNGKGHFAFDVHVRTEGEEDGAEDTWMSLSAKTGVALPFFLCGDC